MFWNITPAKANQIGYNLAMSLTKGNYAFIVCTHVDKAHVHSHIIFNSTSLDCSRKFRNFWRSSFADRTRLEQFIGGVLDTGPKDFNSFIAAMKAAGARFDALTDPMKANDTRMKEIAEMQKHIGAYGKTREIYAQIPSV